MAANNFYKIFYLELGQYITNLSNTWFTYEALNDSSRGSLKGFKC